MRAKTPFLRFSIRGEKWRRFSTRRANVFYIFLFIFPRFWRGFPPSPRAGRLLADAKDPHVFSRAGLLRLSCLNILRGSSSALRPGVVSHAGPCRLGGALSPVPSGRPSGSGSPYGPLLRMFFASPFLLLSVCRF